MSLLDAPYHLRNTVEYLDLPIFMDLEGDWLRTPADLALGDTLMVLGFIRNLGRGLRLACDSRYRELLAAFPLVRELAPAAGGMGSPALKVLPLASSGRPLTYLSDRCHRLVLPPRPIDQVRANHVLAHSLHYQAPRRDDRPGAWVPPDLVSPLAGLLARKRPTLVVYPLNPGRENLLWHDTAWWRELFVQLGKEFALVAVGAGDYGELAGAVDAVLPADDPASTLPDLAWLLGRAAGFVGRDGGLAHLATAMGNNVLVVWDSMLSYRHWASAHARHLVLANPYGFRYPQAFRISRAEMLARLGAADSPERTILARRLATAARAGGGGLALGEEDWAALAMGALEAEEDEAGLRAWLKVPQARGRIYRESLAFALRALAGRDPATPNWVVPAFP